MKRTRILALLLSGGLCLPALVRFAAANTPFDAISQRNVFALLPPPPPVPPTPPTPPANIKLTGISTWNGEKKAMLMVQDTSGPNKPDLSTILREGEKQNGVECLEINEPLGYVKVKNNDVVSTLTFDANGMKPSGGGAPPPMPTALTAPPILNPPRPGIPNPTTTAIEQPRPRGGLRQIPSRTLRLPGGENSGMPMSPMGAPAGQVGGGMPVSMGSTVAGGMVAANAGNQSAQTPQNQPSNLTADQQQALILIDQEMHKNDKTPYPPVPGLSSQ